MTLLAPHFLWVGLAFAAAVITVHFIVTRQPKSEPFPTARFVPESPVEAVSRSTRPSDLFLLLLRVLALLSLAAAFARPVLTPSRNQTVRIILADVTAASRTIADVRDSAKKYYRPGDVLIAFDSSAREIRLPDSLPLAPSSRPGTLSPALITALRSARHLRNRADSISLIVVSAFPGTSWDAATDTIRTLWPGAIRIVRVAPRADTNPSRLTAIVTDLSVADPLRVAVSLAEKVPHARSVRIVRAGELPATLSGSEVVLHWPSRDRPRFASHAVASSRAGVVIGGVVVFGTFTAEWAFTADSVRGSRVLARWTDGTPAAIQRDLPGGCIRSSSISVTGKGDLVIRPEFVTLVRGLIAPCAGLALFAPLEGSQLLRLKGGSAAAPRSAFSAADGQESPFTVWLLLAAAFLLGAEQFLRRTKGRSSTAPEQQSMRVAA